MFRALKPGDLCAKNRNGNLPLQTERKLTKHSYIHVYIYIPAWILFNNFNQWSPKKEDRLSQPETTW